jgi:guanylate kinase
MTNKLIVFSAPSGAGKTTLVKYILKTFREIQFSISATSRKARGEEKDGKDYYFLSNEEFKARIKNDEFIEYEEVYGGNYYGTLKSEVNRIWKEKKIAIFDIDVVGGANIKSMFPNETLSIFVMPPSIDILYRRLIERGDVNKQEIDVRIKKAESELDYASKFDNIIINNDLEESKKIAHTLIKEFIDE